MEVVYIDEVFALNALMDYLLLLCAAKLAGEPFRRLRFALAALLGGLYAAGAVLPGWGFLTHPLCKLASAVGMALAAYGSSRRLLRLTLVFFGVAAAFGGGVLALQLLWGSPRVLDLPTVLLCSAFCYVFLSFIFRRTLRHGGGELAGAELELGGRRCRLTALVDTVNTFTYSFTVRPFMLADGVWLGALFRPVAVHEPG